MTRSQVPWHKQLWRIKTTFVLVLAPLVFLPLLIVAPSNASKCAYGILIMAVYWITEVIPMAVTALLPIVIFPWLGVLDTKKACENYFKDANVLFFGGLMVAVAVEKWNLHKRIALRVLMLVGSKPKWLMFGFMVTTAFLSMWISNTATCAMMVPISHAILTELSNHRAKVKTDKQKNFVLTNRAFEPDGREDTPEVMCHKSSDEEAGTSKVDNEMTSEFAEEVNVDVEMVRKTSDNNEYQPKYETFISDLTSGDEPSYENTSSKASGEMEKGEGQEEMDKWFEKVGKGMCLSIAYAANIGGTATLTGTGPNLVLKGQLDVLYGPETGINFSSWFVFAFPNMIISLALVWLWLMLLFLGPKEILNFVRKQKDEVDDATSVIKKEYEKLGRMSFAEIEVLVLFIILAVLWLTRHPGFIPGWGSLLQPFGWVTDSCVAITISVLLFMLPARWPNYLCFRRQSDEDEPEPAPPLLDWPTVHKQIPWSVLLLLGGGFAMAEGSKESGLSFVIGKFFSSFGHLPKWGLVFILSTLTAVFTEVTSNVATATIFLPILAELATTLHTNPLYLMLPVTISASFAFMLPVATPPNAIVFAYGNMKILDMMKAGIVPNCVCLLILQLATNTWGYAYFNLGTFPKWACKRNCEMDNTTIQPLWNYTTFTPTFTNSTTSPF